MAVLLTREPLDPAAMLAAVADPAAGGNVLFVGTARDLTGGVATASLEYEAHEPLARSLLAAVLAEARERFGLVGSGVAHRLGLVAPGEASVAVAASAPHRREAFAAAEWIMDEIKRTVPIWKCEHRPDGSHAWVHGDKRGQAPFLRSTVVGKADEGRAACGGREMVPDPFFLIDGFGRVHTDLRISVTDRCNLRCTYCMPAEVIFRPREELLAYEEIARVAGVAAGLGIRTIRLTGGEPLVRRDVAALVRLLVALPGIEEVALTTNGLLLAEQAADLRAAGLARLNISLDALGEEAFERITRRRGLDRVLAGIAAARAAGFERLRINAVSIRGLTEGEIVPLARFCRGAGLHLRFIEFMPLDADDAWSEGRVLSGAEVRAILAREVGPLEPLPATDPGQPAVDWRWADGEGIVGFIDPVTSPFCDRCDRLRLTADGQFRNCLFSTTEWDVRSVLRGGGDDAEIAALLQDCVAAKRAAHGIGSPAFERPARAMYEIGG